jgi:KDO2-lipid IV(A) lauroyltransferase
MDKLQYLFLKLLYVIFTVTPFKVVEQIANIFAFIIQHIIQYRRKVIEQNLEMVYGEHLPGNKKDLIKSIYRNFTYLWFEALQTNKITKKNIDHHFTTHRFERLSNSLKEEKGVIIMGGHLGNFEWVTTFLGIKNIPFEGIVKKIKNKYIDQFMRTNREKNGCKMIYLKTALRQGMKALRSNKLLGIVADQDARKKGIFVNFLGQPSSTAIGPAIFQLRSGAPMLFIAPIRTRYAHFDIYFDVIEIPADLKISDESIHKILEAYSKVLEKWIRKYPEQWFWMHKRWKSKPKKDK